MRHLLIAIALLAAPPSFAEGLSQTVQSEATRLQGAVETVRKTANARPTLKPQALSPALVLDLQRFGLSAARLSAEIDANGGPTDLRCIFRGMSEETDTQLKAASAAVTNAQQADALDRLSHMLRDAAEIAPAAMLKNTTAANPVRAAAVGSCPASKF